jgi:hypothetical protein
MGCAKEIYDFVEKVEMHVNRRNRAMYMLRNIILKKSVIQKVFRKEIYTSEMVGDLLM